MACAAVSLLQNAQKQTYIEFGAGKGYLSSMLADGSDAKQLVVLDNQTFRMKADRYDASTGAFLPSYVYIASNVLKHDSVEHSECPHVCP